MRKKAGIAIIVLLGALCGCAGMSAAAAEEKSAAPGPPNELKLVLVPNGFRIAWKPSPQDPGIVTGYEVVRADLASGPFVRIATLPKGVHEYTDTTASSETIYYYKVRAMAGTAYSRYSNTVTGER
jgi:hypothetical protein